MLSTTFNWKWLVVALQAQITPQPLLCITIFKGLGQASDPPGNGLPDSLARSSDLIFSIYFDCVWIRYDTTTFTDKLLLTLWGNLARLSLCKLLLQAIGPPMNVSECDWIIQYIEFDVCHGSVGGGLIVNVTDFAICCIRDRSLRRLYVRNSSRGYTASLLYTLVRWKILMQ